MNVVHKLESHSVQFQFSNGWIVSSSSLASASSSTDEDHSDLSSVMVWHDCATGTVSFPAVDHGLTEMCGIDDARLLSILIYVQALDADVSYETVGNALYLLYR